MFLYEVANVANIVVNSGYPRNQQQSLHRHQTHPEKSVKMEQSRPLQCSLAS